MASGTQWFVDGRKLLSNAPVSNSPKRMVGQILPVAVEKVFFSEFTALKGWPSALTQVHETRKLFAFNTEVTRTGHSRLAMALFVQFIQTCVSPSGP